MKKLLVLLAIFTTIASMAQSVGINTDGSTANSSAILDVSSTTKGFLPPRMTTTQRDVLTPTAAEGLVIFNTTTNTLEYNTSTGWVSCKSNPDGTAAGQMQYWNGSNWVNITTGSDGQVLKYTSNIPTWSTLNTYPDAPTIGTAAAGNLQATVAFTPPVNNGGSAITSYTLFSNPQERIATGTSSPITITGLTRGTNYNFKVTATNTTSTSLASSLSNTVLVGTLPSAPAITSVTSASVSSDNGQVVVAFTAPSDNGGATITGYTATSSPGGITGSVSQAGDGTITVSGLNNGTDYTFTVEAFNSAGNSIASTASASVTPLSVPDAPTSPVATTSNTKASVAFTAPASNGGRAITGYTVTSSPGGFTTTGASSPLTVTGLTNGTSYTFTVIATSVVGNSVASTASTAVTYNCGAFVSSGVYKVFACVNLGATDPTLDPDVPVQALHGNYYQWGRSTVVASDSNSADAISGWNTTLAANSSWLDVSKTANDPCPTGFRVPTKTQWDGVIANNTVSRTGSWANDGNFSTSISWGPNATTKTLTLPVAGGRSNTNGSLAARGQKGFYWSSTEGGIYAWYLNLGSASLSTASLSRGYGFSVRCVSE